jgi:hypothetical protein
MEKVDTGTRESRPRAFIMRDPIKLLQSRATKVPAIRDFLDAIDERTLEDIEKLDIKKSDKKLLRTHFQRMFDYEREAKLNAKMLAAVANMQVDVEEEQHRIYIYEGQEQTYDGFEVRFGDVITIHDDWIRFDYYRIKIKSSVQPILDHCNYLDTMNIADANQLIFNMLNHRHGGGTSEAVGDRYLAGGFTIQRM